MKNMDKSLHPLFHAVEDRQWMRENIPLKTMTVITYPVDGITFSCFKFDTGLAHL